MITQHNPKATWLSGRLSGSMCTARCWDSTKTSWPSAGNALGRSFRRTQWTNWRSSNAWHFHSSSPRIKEKEEEEEGEEEKEKEEKKAREREREREREKEREREST